MTKTADLPAMNVIASLRTKIQNMNVHYPNFMFSEKTYVNLRPCHMFKAFSYMY